MSIIRGLPLQLQANARVFKCRMADELYSGFVADLDHYQETSRRGPDLKRLLQGKVPGDRSERRDLEGEVSTVVKRLKVPGLRHPPKPKANRVGGRRTNWPYCVNVPRSGVNQLALSGDGLQHQGKAN